MKDEILKEFDKEVLGYSMDIIGGYDGKSETIKRPIMCQREDARNFLIKALSARDEEWREKIKEIIDLADDEFRGYYVERSKLEDLINSMK